MKLLATSVAVIGLALGAVSPSSASETKKCEAGHEWNNDSQKCEKKTQ